MKKILLIAFLAIIAGSCDQNKKTDQSPATKADYPQWVKEMMSSFEKENAHAEILQYTYNGKTVFMVSMCYQCPDAIDAVYDENNNVLCQFGGIDGRNTCPDFDQKASDKKIVWRNKNFQY